MLRVYNTLSSKIEKFIPFTEKKVGIYVCGPTVYDSPHIGHARTYISFGSIVRFLKYLGYEVTYVINITDIDDKIIERAVEKGEEPLKLAKRFEKEFLKDLKSLSIQEADIYPRVSDHIRDVIKVVKKLVEEGYGYEVNGNVYFNVLKIIKFGVLSHQSLSDLQVGARLDIDERKKNPMDFALWKHSEENEQGWMSPWGKGRPGWHVECSVLSLKYLGEQFEIHGGGRDLIFPHHENEIVQSEAYTSKIPFVKYWLHTGFLNIENNKMSKSLGNVVTIKDFLKRHDPEVFRLLVLSTHYRRPLNYSEESLKKAERGLERIYETIDKLKKEVDKNETETEHKSRYEELTAIKRNFIVAMKNDFNTARALAQLYKLIKIGNKAVSESKDKHYLQGILDTIYELGDILGFFQTDKDKEKLQKEIQELIKEREKARKKKDWIKADQIRKKLRDEGIELRDYPNKTLWRRSAK